MRKVLHILNTGSFSGAENVVITIIYGLKQKYGNSIQYIYVSLKGNIQERLEKEGIEYEIIDKLSISEMKRLKTKYNPDIVHAHDFTASIICACSMGKIPVISHIHNNPPWIRTLGVKSIVYGISCLKYKYMLGVSESVFDEFIFGGLFKNKEYIVGNPITINNVEEKAKKSSDKSGYDIVFLGRLSSQKNPILFIEIIHAINAKIPVTAVMIGDGELRDAVKNKIRELKLEKVITLKGFMENPYGILQKSKLLCMPSTWEGFGLVAVEALALGIPVLTSGVGGLTNIVDNSCGKICGSKNEYVNEAINLLNNDDIYAAKKEAAYERAGKMDNLENYLELLYRLYNDLIEHI